MSNRALITRRAAEDGVPAPAVERDYVLAHIVAALGNLGDDHGLVFKGGTALRLCYFDDYRYSADLDFSVVKGDLAGAYGTIQAAFSAVTGAVESLTLTQGEPRRIGYRGPLGRQRYLKLDIAVDELVLGADSVGLLPRWPDLPKTDGLRVYSLAEIAGEKLRCIMQRMQCRDLYDLWLLFENADVDPLDASGIFRPKAEHRNLDPAGFETNYRARLEQYRRRWTNELEVHIAGEVPHFGHVERAVSRRLRGVDLI
ncbi:MAG: nucleotidyl transferase AbiEii/AbiGii toxin family protein [Gammaproteobacteria bacterium]|nr:nucleotidyl transferase AbiEii/AbiGii toxin family protein [Gammaproteobacteria bacterium]